MRLFTRKFLVKELPSTLGAWHRETIDQAYLSFGPGVEVVMVKTTHFFPAAQNEQCSYAVHVSNEGNMIIRQRHVVLDINHDEWHRLWPMASMFHLRKERFTRNRLKESHPQCESVVVDVYDNHLKGLNIATVTCADEMALIEFQPLPWFGEEVSNRAPFTEKQLAVCKQIPTLD